MGTVKRNTDTHAPFLQVFSLNQHNNISNYLYMFTFIFKVAHTSLSNYKHKQKYSVHFWQQPSLLTGE